MAARERPVLECRFYVTAAGKEPVREWLRGLATNVKKKVGASVLRVQWGWPIGKPLVDGMGSGLYEVRTTVDGNVYRVLFCLVGSTMVLLHGFQKKTQKTPKADLELARQRMRGEE